MSLKVLIADDSILFRRAIAQVLSSIPDVEVVGSVPNGKMAVQRVCELKPDLLTLDMEMPEMDGLAVLDALRQNGNGSTNVIVVSALTLRGGQLTMRALEKGAFDFITKPDAIDAEKSKALMSAELVPRIRALTHRLAVRNILRSKPAALSTTPSVMQSRPAETSQVVDRMQRVCSMSRPEMVLIGVSTGGPNALARLLPGIPANLGVPILIVQHMPPIFTQTLAESLAPKCPMRVREAVSGEALEPNTIYIAPGGRQMRLQPGPNERKIIQVNDDPPENNCRPSVDYLFRSAALHYPGKTMAVILTGMGGDGTLGLKLLKRQGCFVIAQDEASCVVYGMPKAAVDAGVVDVILPLDGIAARIASTVHGGMI